MNGPIKRIWVVRDPSPTSVLVDVLFMCTPSSLHNYARGCQPGDWEREHTTLYFDEPEARADALQRLAARKEAKVA